MLKPALWLLAGVILGVAIGHYGERIAGAYGEAVKVQLHLDETNVKLEALERRVEELEGMDASNDQRIGVLEGKVNH